MTPEESLTRLAVVLPPPGKPMGLYCPILVDGSRAYLSGHGPLQPDGSLLTGRLGDDLQEEDGYVAARQTALAVLATLRGYLGSLNRIERLIKTVGMVQCTPDFHTVPAVINGFSELMREVFGPDRGVAARSAIGVNSLPANMAVEIECIFRLARS
ncbi:MAG: RidA family protein [Pirellulales bacterium]|nr:RidA family protein [Pirellulales bacterium]